MEDPVLVVGPHDRLGQRLTRHPELLAHGAETRACRRAEGLSLVPVDTRRGEESIELARSLHRPLKQALVDRLVEVVRPIDRRELRASPAVPVADDR
jgi:hypothetical protein